MSILRLFPILFLCLFSLVTSHASAELVIVSYDTTNPNGTNGDPSPDLPAADQQSFVTSLPLSRGPGLTPNNGVAFNSSDWPTNGSVNLQSTDYLQWGWSASSTRVDLSEMTIQYDRSGNGPTQLEIFLSVDDAAFQSVFSDGSIQVSDETHTINLANFNAVSSARFRLYAFDANSDGGTLDIERFIESPSRGIEVRGSVTAVPEPSTAVILLLATAVASRRRQDV